MTDSYDPRADAVKSYYAAIKAKRARGDHLKGRPMSGTMRIDSITVGPRFRRDFSGVEALAASIAAVGLLQPPGVTPDGQLLWGECRLRACLSLGWTEIPVIVRDVDPSDFVAVEAAENFARKDFTPSEAVAIMRKLEPGLKAAAAVRQKAGRPVGNLPEGGRVLERIAGYTGFGRRTLEKADAVVSAAEAEPDRFGKLVADMNRTGRVDGVWRRLSNMQQAERIRAEPPPLPAGPFRVISIDPPWAFEVRQEDPSHRGITPYPPMSLDAIRALPVAQLAAVDAILWLWTINLLLADGTAGALLKAWGFEPRTILTWFKTDRELGKERFGFGDWLRGSTEHCIMAVRGRPVHELHNEGTWIFAPMRGHSEKPDSFYSRVESLCPAPAGGYLEMFARKPRPGWVTWGDEAPRLKAAE